MSSTDIFEALDQFRGTFNAYKSKETVTQKHLIFHSRRPSMQPSIDRKESISLCHRRSSSNVSETKKKLLQYETGLRDVMHGGGYIGDVQFKRKVLLPAVTSGKVRFYLC